MWGNNRANETNGTKITEVITLAGFGGKVITKPQLYKK
ncbi:hypothetical protein bcere0018_53920 [Bacillus cereus Rock1-15]|nr:hypothetical protein bcere0018_53920 [Bacillus cereus Rock1-15]